MRTQFLIAPAALLLAACTGPAPQATADKDLAERGTGAATVLIDPGASGACPYLTRDPQGRVVMGWVRGAGEEAVMCFAVSGDGGHTFGAAQPIGPSRGVDPHGENLPKLVFLPKGEVFAAWGLRNPDPRNKYAGVVRYARSPDQGKTWGEAQDLVQDTAGFDQRYFDLAVLPNGEAGIIWLDNRKQPGTKGHALYMAETMPGNGFMNGRAIKQSTCECCRTKLLVDDAGRLHIVYRAILGDTVRDMVHAVSKDGGITFSDARRISADNWVIDGCPHSGPTMAQDGSAFRFAWYSAANEQPGVYATSSTDDGRSFAARERLSAFAQTPHPQMAALPGGGVVTAWEETLRGDSVITSKIVLRRSGGDPPEAQWDVSGGADTDGFPVLAVLGGTEVLVAWTREAPIGIGASTRHRKGGGQVCYQVVRLREGASLPETAPMAQHLGSLMPGMDPEGHKDQDHSRNVPACCAHRPAGPAMAPAGPR